ncbi:endonuclease/exonuclease/phosphatase [Pelobium manganitolerans]|uniref:Endonuclease/exonuclease/phosphatase n=1 Tax=Pelobium manganitolerans TaxID=1842495 RepID=A0A419SBR6_9SPHI|nr:endonuclease/exonuclease/phosphatase family protein [Pelobium manganitolerans]RKD20248.1 endonuclease/exonuclease/phosphatase [Pelobium manganitolerans]
MKRKKNSWWHNFLLFLNSLAIIALILSYCATAVDPLKVWYFTLFGLAYPFILLANILFVLCWIMYRRAYFLLSLALIIAGYKPLTRTFGFRLASQTDNSTDSSSLKLMTYNVHNFRSEENQLDSALAKDMMALLRKESPDILGMQEFFFRRRGKFAFKDSIYRALNFNSYYFCKADSNDYEANGIVLFSKYPISRSGEIKFENGENGNKGIWADLLYRGQSIRVYVVHLASISFQPEDYSFVNEVKNNPQPSKQDVRASKRIVRKLKIAFERRSSEIKLLKAHMASCKTPYLILGDFNDTPASFALAQMSDGMHNAFQKKGSGLGKTYNGEFPNFQIDYVLASPSFEVESYRIIKKNLSDHYPVRVNLVLSR